MATTEADSHSVHYSGLLDSPQQRRTSPLTENFAAMGKIEQRKEGRKT